MSCLQDLHNHVVTQSAQAFVTSFLVRCLRSNIEHTQNAETITVATLDVARILPRYRHTQKRLLLIDFEGTIWQRDITTIARNTGVLAGSKREFVPPEEVIRLLNRLAEDPKNQVWLLSGLPVKGMLDVVAEKAPTIGIVYVLLPRGVIMSLTLP